MTILDSINRRAPRESKSGLQATPEECDWKKFRNILVCPSCRGNLADGQATLLCLNCGGQWPLVDRVPDFRHDRKAAHFDDWQRFQDEFEREAYDPRHALRDREGCREAYERLPVAIKGSFLDVGGADGTVRHFLPQDVEYLCVDPFLEAPRLAKIRGQDARFREVFPCLTEAYPFVCAMAESLPIRSTHFDWVHMRSMIDHVLDPTAVLKEGFRCLRRGGHLLIGVSARGGRAKTMEPGLVGLLAQGYRILHYEGPKEFVLRGIRRLQGHRDHHLWHPSIEDLRKLITNSGFQILHENWTSPPFDHVVYILARRPLHAD